MSSTLRQQIQDEQKQAMKNRDEARLSTLRMLWSGIRNKEIDTQHELTEQEVQEVVGRQLKQLSDALTDFTAGGRNDLIEKTKQEMVILTAYMPAQLSDEELEQIVRDSIATLGASSAQDSGKVMGAVMKQVSGKADGNRVRAMVSQILSP